jgi:hypothetical protein
MTKDNCTFYSLQRIEKLVTQYDKGLGCGEKLCEKLVEKEYNKIVLEYLHLVVFVKSKSITASE